MKWSIYLSLALLPLLWSCEDQLPEIDSLSENISVESSRGTLIAIDSLSALSEIETRFGVTIAGYQDFAQYVTNGVVLYKVSYLTEYQGNEIQASGLLAIPDSPLEAAPILSAQHGTLFAHSTAPSLYDPLKGGNAPLELLASAGFVAIVADYIGFGDSDTILHPYYNKEASAVATVDFIRASKVACDSLGMGYSDDLFLFGYSEGGYVSMAAHEYMENDPDLDLEVTASAVGAGGYDLKKIMNVILDEDIYDSPNFLGYILASYQNEYQWTVGHDYYFSEPYASRIDSLYSGLLSNPQINNGLNDTLEVLLDSGFVARLMADEEDDFFNALEENSVHKWISSSPVKMYHGTEDKIVPFEEGVSSYEAMVALGNDQLTLEPLDGKNHGSSIKPMIYSAVPWFLSFL